jgi:hypothetical protein
MKRDIKNILFWIFLILSLILLLWNIFGNSPTEFLALVAIIITGHFKMWSVSEKLIKLEMRFNTLARDFKGHLK